MTSVASVLLLDVVRSFNDRLVAAVQVSIQRKKMTGPRHKSRATLLGGPHRSFISDQITRRVGPVARHFAPLGRNYYTAPSLPFSIKYTLRIEKPYNENNKFYFVN